jgi:hypothetical protein
VASVNKIFQDASNKDFVFGIKVSGRRAGAGRQTERTREAGKRTE